MFLAKGQKEDALRCVKKALAIREKDDPHAERGEGDLLNQKLLALKNNEDLLAALFFSRGTAQLRWNSYRPFLPFLAKMGDASLGIALTNRIFEAEERLVLEEGLFESVRYRNEALWALFAEFRKQGNAEGCRAVMEAMPDEAWRETLRRAWIKSFAPHS